MPDLSLNRFVARGTNAERLAFTPDPPTPASGPDPGYVFYETDTGDFYAWDGAAWDLVNAAGAALPGTIGATFDGGGSALTAGAVRYVLVPYAHTITANYMLADQSGSAVVDVWRDTYANYPPTVADSITASAKPTLSSAIKSTDSTLTGWSTSGAADTIYAFKLDSVSTIQVLTVQLVVTRD